MARIMSPFDHSLGHAFEAGLVGRLLSKKSLACLTFMPKLRGF